MPERPTIASWTLAEFGERLAARTPSPGGGNVNAHLAGLGAALVSMAFRFTSGEHFSSVEGAMVGRVEALDRLREEANALMEREAAAQGAVTTSFQLPREDDESRATRRRAVQDALKMALEVSRRTMEIALEGLRIAADGVKDVNPNLASDCCTGAFALWAASQGAHLGVPIHASSIKDEEYVDRNLAACARMHEEAARLVEVVGKGTKEHLK